MKRSEALKKIEMALDLLETTKIEALQTTEDRAIALLDLVEQLGMAPPYSSEVFFRQKAAWGIEAAHGNEWDPE